MSSKGKSSSKKNQKKSIDLEEEEEQEQDINEEEENNEEQESNEEEELNEEDENNEEENKENDDEEELNEEKESDKENIEETIANIGEESLKIQNIINILSDFKNKRENGKSRNDYITQLKTLVKNYYEYNDDICDLIFNLFPPNEAIEFIQAAESQKIISIRTNSLKTKRRELAKNLINRGVNLDPLAEWSKVGLKIYSSSVPVGATPEYLTGQYMLQSASSFLPVLALNPQPGEKILDMCAAPGGKTTYIGQLLKNDGILVANDFKKERIKSLFFNIHRMGIKNTIITNYDGREFAKLFNKFDRVLLDAPCSGLGVISKDKSIKMNRTYKEILNNSKLQKELILAAIDSCNTKGKGGGIIVYSTCSISVEENEWVIDYALKHRYVKCIDPEIAIGEPGIVTFREKHFHPSVKNTKRIYPHIHNMDGFFIAKLKKYSDGPKIKGNADIKNKDNKKNEDNESEIEDSEESEPEDVQEQIQKGKLKNYNGDKEQNDGEDDGIFSGEEYEKDEEDIEEMEKKKNVKKGFNKKNKNADKSKKMEKKEENKSNKKKEKNNEKENNKSDKKGKKDEDTKENKSNKKEKKIENKNEDSKNIKNEKKEENKKDDNKNNGKIKKEDKSAKKGKKSIEKERNDSTEKEKRGDSKILKKEKNEDIKSAKKEEKNKNDEKDDKKSTKKEKTEEKKKSKKESEDNIKMLSKKRKNSQSKDEKENKSTKKAKK